MSNGSPLTCDFCERDIPEGQWGHTQRALGGMYSCQPCRRANWDGWAPHYEKKIIAWLDDSGHPHPPRNEKELFPCE